MNVTKIPGFLKLLSFTELWERFSFYGLLSLLIIFLTSERHIPDSAAYATFGMYMTLAYFGPFIGGLLADRVFGAQKMLLAGGTIIALGHFVIGISIYHFGLFYFGLGLVAIGTGMFKGNITTLLSRCYHNSDLPTDERERGFTLYYVGINIGAGTAAMACGYAADLIDWGVGFSLAGFGMVLGLIVFVCKRHILQDCGAPPATESRLISLLQKYSFPVLLFAGALIGIVLATIIQSSDHIKYLKELFGVIASLTFIFFLTKAEQKERHRICVIFLLALVLLLFFALEHQLFGMLNLFAKRNVATHLFGIYLPSQTLSTTNAITIVIVGSLLSAYFAKQGLAFSVYRIILCFALTAVCFILLYLSCYTANEQYLISPLYALISVIFMSIGEVFMAPLVFGLIPYLAPVKQKYTMTGIGMLAISFSNIGSFILAKIAAVPEIDGKISSAQSLIIYQHNFLAIVIYCVAVMIFVGIFALFMHRTIMQKHRLSCHPMHGDC